MNHAPPSCPGQPEPSSKESAAQTGRWRLALILSLVMLVPLGWLMARLVWLPLYSGLFSFLVAGLLVGALTFRVAKPARPVSTGHILVGISLVAVGSMLVTIVWEYRNVAATVSGETKFADARNAAVAARRPVHEVESSAEQEFLAALRRDHAPGGPIGYVLWATRVGQMDLVVRGCKDTVEISHRGAVWPMRTLAALLLLVAGLWLSFESLRSTRPVTNILAPGEEAEEEED